MHFLVSSASAGTFAPAAYGLWGTSSKGSGTATWPIVADGKTYVFLSWVNGCFWLPIGWFYITYHPIKGTRNNHWLGSFFIRFSLFLFQFWIGKPMKPWCSTLKKIPCAFSLGILVGDELHSKVTRRHPWPGRYWRSAKGEAAFRGMKTEGYVGCGHKWPPEACWSHHFWVVFNRFVECFGRMC